MADLSIIIPYYNGSKYFNECLNSIRSELLKPRNIIIINDGSSVEETHLMEEIISLYDDLPLTVYSQNNGGQGSARNTGARFANTEYIAFLDQDDRVLPNHNQDLLSAMLKARKESPLFIYAFGDVRQINQHSAVVCNNISKRNRLTMMDDAYHVIANDLFILPGASLFLRSAFLEIGGFDTRLTGYEDDDLFQRIYRSGSKGICIDQEVTDWRIHNSSTSYSIRMMTSRYKYYVKLLQSYPDDLFQSRYYTNAIQHRFFHWFKSDLIKTIYEYAKSPSDYNLERLKVAACILKLSKVQLKKHRKGGIVVQVSNLVSKLPGVKAKKVEGFLHTIKSIVKTPAMLITILREVTLPSEEIAYRLDKDITHN